MKKLKIGWQKYEDFIEKQVSSPIIESMIDKMSQSQGGASEEKEEYIEQTYEVEEEEEASPLMIPMTAKFYEDMSLLSTYDCWLGHTNFNITHVIKQELDKVDGIEILKVCSRYRFFIGIGQMFNFQDVRKQIEENIVPN